MLNSFSYVYSPPVFFLWWNIYSDLLPIFYWVACLLFDEFWEFVIYSTYKPFIIYMICKSFIQICVLSFHFLNKSFEEQILILMKLNLSVFPFMSYTFFLSYFLKILFILVLERGEGKARGWETSMCGCLLHAPYWGPGLQPRHVP